MPTGIRRHHAGWQAEVRIVGHPRSVQQFPLDTPLEQIVLWRKREKARLQLTSPHATGSFLADARRYLELVRTMPSYAMRVRDIELWAAVFGPRPLDTITAHEIQLQRDRWREAGPKRVWRKHPDRYGGAWIEIPAPLAPSTVNHRLRALANLFTVLRGRHAPNPAREVPELAEPESIGEGLPYELIEIILAQMPDRRYGRALTQNKARLRVMAYVGLPQSLLMRLTPMHVHLEEAWVDWPGRRKGRGVKGQRRPLTSDGVAAFRAFIAANCWGPFSTDSMAASFQRACRKVAATVRDAGDQRTAAVLERLRPYDLRHSYVTEVLDKSGDFHSTQLLAGHADLRTTLSYGRKVVSPALRAAMDQITAAGGFKTPT
jgi:site-specific recombinase XerC